MATLITYYKYYKSPGCAAVICHMAPEPYQVVLRSIDNSIDNSIGIFNRFHMMTHACYASLTQNIPNDIRCALDHPFHIRLGNIIRWREDNVISVFAIDTPIPGH